MVKQLRKEQLSGSEESDSEQDEEEKEQDQDMERAGASEDEQDDSGVDSDVEIAVRDQQEDLEEKFGLKAINDEEGMLKRLREIQLNFYSRMESKKLVKKQGKIPFTEHMTISKQYFVFMKQR